MALLVGGVVGALLSAALTNEGKHEEPITRERLVDAFRDEGIMLKRQFGASTGLVDASYTISNDGPPDKSPLVVELLRTIATAEARETFLIEKAPETEMELTVLRARNVVAVLIGRDADLLKRVQSVMDELD